ncbi:MAG: flavin-containing monooxygenase [Mycobacterium sp.]
MGRLDGDAALTPDALRIAVIGAGPAGLAAGHELLARGFTNFTIFEATDAVGGTWHLHTYPGLACDVWAHAYTFSYRPNAEWSASFVEQPEIEAYLQTCAREFGLTPHITLNTRIAGARYQDDGYWVLESTAGERFEFDVVINAMGNQHTPRYPNVPGINEFQGASFHGTRWDHGVELTGKRVVVVGSAASAVQIVPEVAKVAGTLTVLQRSPNWIMPRGRRFYSDAQRLRWRRLPVTMLLIRRVQQFLMSLVHDAATLGHNRARQFESRARAFIDRAIPDPQLRAALTPTDPYGCKRGLVSDDFYPALLRDNVELIPEGLRAVRPTGVTTASGREIDADVIIFCTGYRILDFDRIDVVGEAGESLAEATSTSIGAFKGIAVPHFPNYFLAVGPNGLPLDVPYFRTVERNIKTIVGLLVAKQAAGVRALAVNPKLHLAYNDWLAERFGRYSWASPSCSSYYQDANGRTPFLFPGRFKEYAKLHDQSGLHEYDLSPVSAGSPDR